MRRTSALIGAALVAAVFLGLLISTPGCAVGFTDPSASGARSALVGVKLGDIPDAVNAGVGTLFDALGGWVGVGGLGGVGAVAAGLVRSLIKARTGEAHLAGANKGWDEALGTPAGRPAVTADDARPVADGRTAGVVDRRGGDVGRVDVDAAPLGHPPVAT